MTKSAASQSEPKTALQMTPHQAIYRRWRAQTFSQMVGQTAVVQALQNAVRTGRVAHAILFVGPRGTGKTSLARILAKAINCTDLRDGDPCDACPSCVAIREGRALDLVEIDAASNRGIDAIRELRERINYAPTDLKQKVYILDEAHQITKDAWNALLKSLEEPPDFVVFMFASTHPQDFPPAILSRLQRFDVRRLAPSEIEGKLARILDGDGREADPAALRLIARLAAGGMRDAESMLDQLLASGAGRLDEDTVRDLLGLVSADTIDEFIAAMSAADIASGVRLLDEIEDRGRDLRAFLEQLVEVVRAGLLGGPRGGVAGESVGYSVGDMVRLARRLGDIDPNRAGIGGLRLQLELALFPDATGRPLAVPEVLSRGVAVISSTGPQRPPGPVGVRAFVDPGIPHERVESQSAPVTDKSARGADPTVGSRDNEARQSARAPTRLPGAPGPSTSQSTPVPNLKRPSALPGSAVSTKPQEAAGAAEIPAAISDLDRLRLRWPEVVARVSAHPPTKPLITVCLPISVEDGIVTLGFPEDQGFLRDVAERRRTVLEDNIAAVLGRAVGVRCVATNLDHIAPLPADTEAAFVLAEARRIFETDEPGAADIS